MDNGLSVHFLFFVSALEHAGLAAVLSASEPAGTGLENTWLVTTHDVL